MISLVVTADTKNYNPAERDQAFENMLIQFKQPFEIIYVANSDYGNLQALRDIVKDKNNRQLIVTAPSTNINTQIYNAFDYTNNGDVLLATMDTNVELVGEMLKRHIDGADLVFVKKQENWFKSMFVALGQATYQMGLKLLGRGRDMCCEPRVVLLNNRSINTIILNPTLSKALRLVNPDPERSARVVSRKAIFDNPTTEQKNSNNTFLALGVVSTFYLIALLVMAIVFPLSNSGVYTYWIFIALIIWVLLGIIGSVVSAKFVYDARLGIPVAVNLAGEPVINIVEQFYNGKQIVENIEDKNEKATEPKQPKENKIKKATKSVKENIKQEVSTKLSPNEEASITPTTPSPAEIPIENSVEETKGNVEETKENATEQQNVDKPTTKTTKAQKTTSNKSTKAKKSTTKSSTKKPAISKIKGTKSAKTKKN